MTQTAGAVRAANRYFDEVNNLKISSVNAKKWLAEIIDEETHAAEMEAFIEKVAKGKFHFAIDALHEAYELLQKVRGEI